MKSMLQTLTEYQYGPDIIEPTEDPEYKFIRGAGVASNANSPSDHNQDTNTQEPEGYDEQEEELQGDFIPMDNSTSNKIAQQLLQATKGDILKSKKMAELFYKSIIQNLNKSI